MFGDWTNDVTWDAVVTAIELGTPIALAVVGYYFANNYARQARTQLAEARRKAYAELWEVTGLATPTRLDRKGWGGALKPAERKRLDAALTSWYYRDGNGMLLGKTTREMYLAAKHNLDCEPGDLKPKGILCCLPPGMSDDDRRGCLSIRQLSLLRSQMKADLAIYGLPFVGDLSQADRAFLRKCGIRARRWGWRVTLARLGLDPGPKPWTAALRAKAEPERCGCPETVQLEPAFCGNTTDTNTEVCVDERTPAPSAVP